MQSKRALIVIRLSRQVEESTSAERQLEECRRVCAALGWEVVGVAEDLNVSAGATTPFERPELGKWMGDGRDNPGRSHEFDALVFWRLDRLVRSMLQLADVMKWADTYGIALKSATESHIDTTGTMGKIIPLLVASFAEMELEAIRERITSDQRHRIRTGNFRGGTAPWGYKPVDHPEKGRVLAPDPEQVRQITKANELVLEGVAPARIARDFNDSGELTPKDRQRVIQGKSPKGLRWYGGKLKEMLTSKAMLGYIITSDPVLDANGKHKRDQNGALLYSEPYTVTNDDGTPKLRAEPVVDRETFEKVGAKLRDRENQSHVSERSKSLLLGVLHCGYCGNVAYRMRGGKGRKLQYRCKTKQLRGKCDNPTATVELEWVDTQIEQFILSMMGDAHKRVRVWREGEDHSGEIIELEARLGELVSVLGTGTFKEGSKQRELLLGQIDSVSERLEEISELDSEESGWEWKSTPDKFSDWWEAADIVQRNQYLVAAGVRVEYRHRPDRKRGDYPNLHIIAEDLEAFQGEYDGAETIERLREITDAAPKGHNIVLEDGEATLEKREV